jgi:hypothetical protein
VVIYSAGSVVGVFGCVDFSNELVQGESYLSGMSCCLRDRDEGSCVGTDGGEGMFLGGVDVDCGDYFVKCRVHGTTKFT